MKKLYFVKGAGAASILADPEFQQVFRAIGAGHNVVFDTSHDRTFFLNQFFQSHLVYLSLHNAVGRMELVVGNGDRVTLADLASAPRPGAQGGRMPVLVIATGCQTIHNPAGDLAAAIGIQNGTSKRAFIGFTRNVIGNAGDRYFRVFLAHWLKPGPTGAYRTLREAQEAAGAFMKRQLALQKEVADLGGAMDALRVPEKMGPKAGVRVLPGSVRIAASLDGAPWTPSDATIGKQFAIVGDVSLRATDL